jgi:signal transduction histidine kinase
MLLEEQGFRVLRGRNGAEALPIVVNERPDLIISDVMMPEMTGYELCAQLKADPELSEVPVILVTTLSDPQDVIRGLECRADNFILKPYEADHLMRHVQFVLVNSRMRQGDQPGMGLEIMFRGQKHFITADRLQILNLLLSTYEAAIQRNKELSSTRDTLHQTNEQLQQLTHDLEGRVTARTRELEETNEALRQAQKALIQQERLSALGQMASGIAHDINNAISPIALYTESLLEREPGLSGRARKYLASIQRAIDDVAQTVARMREFYRPREQEQYFSDVNLNELITQVVDLTRARWSDQPQRRGIMVELSTELAPDLGRVRGAENEIRDALTNLIFNAVDAMPDGGRIEIRTGSRSAGGHGGASVAQSYLSVRDTGTGMDDETRRRCLEPFFTTKGERGTGLGLAMVYGMAQRHGATLEIESTPGAGTTMRLLFPVGGTASTASTRAPPDTQPARPLRILLIDDDGALLQSLRDALEGEGHVVTTAGGGQAGIDAFRDAQRSGAPFEVVITDLGMPYVDGRQVVRSVRAESDQVRTILLTGWGQNTDSEPPPQADRLLSKPPRLRELRQVLAELTTAPAQAR